MTDMVRDEKELVLPQGHSALILDESKGSVKVVVGPHKVSLESTDKPVVYNPRTRGFDKETVTSAIQPNPFAGEGEYIVLENPVMAPESNECRFPSTGGVSNESSMAPGKLQNGRKVNLPGPISFPLWPGQEAKIVPGHHLQSNQYLVVRIYNEKAARENWDQGVVVTEEGDQQGNSDVPTVGSTRIVMGKLLIIKGTDVSFYIPPTGIEVIPTRSGQYAREAVTLERLEYCILLDQNGNKRYLRGPEVVFPEPTETFVEKNGRKKFSAIELNELMGIYIKVIAPYEDERGNKYIVGDELFITGKDQKIYYPRAEHSIIKYGDQLIHYATTIPVGEGRYVLDRNSGEVKLIEGPKMLLPDPRHQVIVKRILSKQQVELMYPGNHEALEYNDSLRQQKRKSDSPGRRSNLAPDLAHEDDDDELLSSMSSASPLEADNFQRGTAYTPPRSITLDTKYQGAVAVSPYTGYAVMVVNKNGDRRVVQGPSTVLLQYDETLQQMSLSTGKPKTTDRLHRTVYLLTQNNKVSDIIDVTTKDMVEIKIKLSYRVNFEGDNQEKWFSIENYVKFLCDHLRSRLKNMAKRHSVQEFYGNAIDFVRNTVLGEHDAEDNSRPGCSFQENEMRVYDVEVFEVNIQDDEISDLLTRHQRQGIKSNLQLAEKQQSFEVTKRFEEIERATIEEKGQTEDVEHASRKARMERELEASLQQLQNEQETTLERQQLHMKKQEFEKSVRELQLLVEKIEAEQENEISRARNDEHLRLLEAETETLVDKAQAVSPQLVQALQSLADANVAGQVVKGLTPTALMQGDSVAIILEKLLSNTAVASLLKGMISPKANSNGNEHTKELVSSTH